MGWARTATVSYTHLIRLEIEDKMDSKLLKILKKEFDIKEEGIFKINGPLDLTFLMKMYGLPGYEQYKYKPYIPPVSYTHLNNVACCLMHNRKEAVYDNFIEDMLNDLRETIVIAKRAGIADDKIMIDPGVGFAKTYEHNLEAIHHLERLHELSYPILLGTSRKMCIRDRCGREQT